jgi:hypothetical protein
MQNRYSLAYNELIIRQQQSNTNPIYNEQQRRQEERIRSELTQSQNQSGYLRAKNQEVKNRIDDLQRKLGSLRDEGGLSQAKMAKEIQEAKRRLEQAKHDFDEVTNLKTSLEKEITTYRDLLESKEHKFFFFFRNHLLLFVGQNGLRGYVDRIVQNAQQQALDQPAARIGGGSTTIQRTFINTTNPNFGYGGSSGGGGGGGISNLISQSTRPTATGSGYQTISSGIRSTFRSSTGSDN